MEASVKVSVTAQPDLPLGNAAGEREKGPRGPAHVTCFVRTALLCYRDNRATQSKGGLYIHTHFYSFSIVWSFFRSQLMLTSHCYLSRDTYAHSIYSYSETLSLV